jgi:polyribonucleotide nucleotidyltransferase
MDIKFKGGLSRSVFEAALAQAKNGKNHILGEMSKVMDRPSNELSLLVPRMISFEINPNKIGAVIGSGGKIIKEIIEKTGTSVDIEGSKVNIFGKDVAAVAQAETWVRILADQIDVGIKIPGEISRIADFGLFVDIAPGKSGLVHISKIPRNHQNAIDNYYKPGDSLMVEILDYEVESGKIRLGLVSGD